MHSGLCKYALVQLSCDLGKAKFPLFAFCLDLDPSDATPAAPEEEYPILQMRTTLEQ